MAELIGKVVRARNVDFLNDHSPQSCATNRRSQSQHGRFGASLRVHVKFDEEDEIELTGHEHVRDMKKPVVMDIGEVVPKEKDDDMPEHHEHVLSEAGS